MAGHFSDKQHLPPPPAVTGQLSLKILTPDADGGGSAMTMILEPTITGNMLKQRVQYMAKALPEDQLIYFQNGSASAPKRPVEDMKTLEAQGIETGAIITVRKAGENGEGQEDSKENSALRENIQKNGEMSYYYAHKNETPLPLEHRFVSGGAPAKLEEAPAKDLVASTPSVGITKFAWADEGKFVKVYVDAEGEPEVIAGATAAAQNVRCDFQEESFRLTVDGATTSKRFVLHVNGTDQAIVPGESKFRVSAGKRITISLKKKNPSVTWYKLNKTR